MIFSPMLAGAVTLPFTLAADAPPAGGGSSMMIMMLLMFVMMYFILIRPQRNKQKQAEEMQKALAPGDEVVTIGGAHGVITSVRERTIILRMNEGKIEYDRSAIAQRLPKDAPVTVEAPK